MPPAWLDASDAVGVADVADGADVLCERSRSRYRWGIPVFDDTVPRPGTHGLISGPGLPLEDQNASGLVVVTGRCKEGVVVVDEGFFFDVDGGPVKRV